MSAAQDLDYSLVYLKVFLFLFFEDTVFVLNLTFSSTTSSSSDSGTVNFFV